MKGVWIVWDADRSSDNEPCHLASTPPLANVIRWRRLRCKGIVYIHAGRLCCIFSFKSAPASRLNPPLVWNVHAHLKRMRITWTHKSTWSGRSDFAEGHEIRCWRCFIWQAGDLKSLEISKRNPLFFFSASTYCSIGLKPYEWKSSFLLSARLSPCLRGFLTHTHWPLYSVNNTGLAPIVCVCE